MAVWWVFQNDSYERSRDGGYLWAPIADKVGNKKFHWETMSKVATGDLILSCKDRSIVALSTAKGAAYLADQPHPDDAKQWTREGRRVDVAYVDLPAPLPVKDLEEIFDLLNEDNGPLQAATEKQAAGRGKQGYLFPVSPRAAIALFKYLDTKINVTEAINLGSEVPLPGPVGETTRLTLTETRTTQQEFRRGLIDWWEGRCAVTGVDLPALLKASHIIPWRLSNPKERGDPANGLLLEAGMDCMFDEGLITFSDDGEMIISTNLNQENRDALGLSQGLKLRKALTNRQKMYLGFHREFIYKN
jgi:putative restriction endonuclease